MHIGGLSFFVTQQQTPLDAQAQKESVCRALGTQDASLVHDIDLTAVPASSQQRMRELLAQWTPESAHAHEIYVSATDHRVAGYGLSMYFESAHEEAVRDLGFDLSGRLVYDQSFSI